MPDQTDQPQPRMTTAQAAKLAQEAHTLARQVDGRLDDLAAVVTDVSTRLQDIGTSAPGERSHTGGTECLDSTGQPVVTRDHVDSRIHEALQPLHDEVHELRNKGTLTPESQGSLRSVLARLEDAERKVAGVDTNGVVTAVAQQLHPTLSELRRRLDEVEKSSGVMVDPEGLNALGRRLVAVEEAVKSFETDPASDTLAEDALRDQVDARVLQALEPVTAELSRMVGSVFERLERVEAWCESNPWLPPATSTGVRATPQATQPTNGLGAARKVLELMRMVTHIGKDRQADMGQGGRFKFRGIDEAMDAVGHAMREVGLILSTEVVEEESATTPVTKKGSGQNGPYESTILWTTTKLTMRYTFVDPEDGSTHTIEMVGEGRDASDKSTSKAGSMAFKYALLQALCIPVTGLDDSDASPPQVMEQERSTPPASRPSSNTDQRASDQAKAKRAGEALQAIRNVHRVEGGPQAQHNRLVQIMNRVNEEGLLEFSLEGSTLNQHGQAAMRTLSALEHDARRGTEPPGEYQPTQQELDTAVRDLPSGQYSPEDDYR